MSRRATTPTSLTTSDLVLLSLLAERPRHGYEINEVLDTRNIRDWAAVSRPHVYYALNKLLANGLITLTRDVGAAQGPDRRVYETTREGLRHLSQALCAETWATDRSRPAFLTWLALSWQAPPGTFSQQVNRRRRFLQSERARERATLKSVRREVGHPYHEAVWMLRLMIASIETELRWLEQIETEAPRRRAARGVSELTKAGYISLRDAWPDK
jgi:DNA-binding PadR family transcriptional regulator